mgnify:CR=1 FL=1
MHLNLASVEGIVACLSLAIIIVQLLVSFFIGGDTDVGGDVGDLDVDVDADADGDSGFDLWGLVTPKGILQFICGFSWYMVLAKAERGGEWVWYDWLIGAVIGIVLMLLVGLLYYTMSKLNNEPQSHRGADLVGRSGFISDRNTERPGVYEFTTTIDGASSEIEVVSKSGNLSLKYGDLATIIAYEDSIYFID